MLCNLGDFIKSWRFLYSRCCPQKPNYDPVCSAPGWLCGDPSSGVGQTWRPVEQTFFYNQVSVNVTCVHPSEWTGSVTRAAAELPGTGGMASLQLWSAVVEEFKRRSRLKGQAAYIRSGCWGERYGQNLKHLLGRGWEGCTADSLRRWCHVSLDRSVTAGVGCGEGGNISPLPEGTRLQPPQGMCRALLGPPERVAHPLARRQLPGAMAGKEECTVF